MPKGCLFGRPSSYKYKRTVGSRLRQVSEGVPRRGLEHVVDGQKARCTLVWRACVALSASQLRVGQYSRCVAPDPQEALRQHGIGGDAGVAAVGDEHGRA